MLCFESSEENGISLYLCHYNKMNRFLLMEIREYAQYSIP